MIEELSGLQLCLARCVKTPVSFSIDIGFELESTYIVCGSKCSELQAVVWIVEAFLQSWTWNTGSACTMVIRRSLSASIMKFTSSTAK